MKKNYNKIFIFFVLIFCFSCKKNTIYQPVQYSGDEFMNASIKKGKNLLSEERKFISNWMIKNNKKDFQESKYGFWIQYNKNTDFPNAKDLDMVKYNIQIEDFAGNIIYSFQEKGLQHGVLSKTHEIRSVESALKMMGEGDEVTLLVPSFFAYGLYGDENKIGKDEPLIIMIQLKEILKKAS